jgi:16S rRNA U516 pseudouridylate synthase RsuA-like enzyme
MTAAVGHPPLPLVRAATGGYALGDLAPGAARELAARDLALLLARGA